MKNHMSDLIGWVGVCLILAAYFTVTLRILQPESPLYLSLNLIGSLAILGETFQKRDLQPAFLNVIWALIALFGLLRSSLN